MSDSASPDVLGSNSAKQLRSVIDRIERLNEDKAAVMADIKEVFAEAKGNGFDVTTIRSIIKIRAMDAAKRAEREALIDLYLTAIGL